MFWPDRSRTSEAMRTTDNGTQRGQAAFDKAAAALKRAAKRYQTTREAIAPAAMAWYAGQDGWKPTPGNRALARVVGAHVKARKHLQQCLTGLRPSPTSSMEAKRSL